MRGELWPQLCQFWIFVVIFLSTYLYFLSENANFEILLSFCGYGRIIPLYFCHHIFSGVSTYLLINIFYTMYFDGGKSFFFSVTKFSTSCLKNKYCQWNQQNIFLLNINFTKYFFKCFSCLTLDERRKDARKILNCDCVKAKPLDWKPNSLSQKNFCEYFFADILSPILFKPYNKVT